MKRPFFLFLFFLLITVNVTAQTHVFIDGNDFGVSPATNRAVSWQMLTPFPGNVRQFTLDSNGQLYISNSAAGSFNLIFKAPPGLIQSVILVQNTNSGVINAFANTAPVGSATYPAGQVAFSASASDQRYFRGTNISTSGLQFGNQNITNWGDVQTNQYIRTNLISTFQPSSANLSNWANLSTNLIGSGNASNAIANLNGTGTNTSIQGLLLLSDANAGAKSVTNVLNLLFNTSFYQLALRSSFNGIDSGFLNIENDALTNSYYARWFFNAIANTSLGVYGQDGIPQNFVIWNPLSAQGFLFKPSGQFSARTMQTDALLVGGAAYITNSTYGLTSTNSLSVTNLNLIGNNIATRTTNQISAIGAGSDAANGTFVWDGSRYTNSFKGSIITNNGSAWLIKSSAGASLYSSTVLQSAAWTILGSSPSPTTVFGALVNEFGQVHIGPINSTNLTWQITNAIGELTLSPTNTGSSGQVLGLTGADVAWVVQTGGGGSNSVSAGTLVTVTTNGGNFAVSALSQTNGFTTLATTNPSMVLMTNIWLPSSNRIFAAIVAATNDLNTLEASLHLLLTNRLTITNDPRALYLTNANNRIDTTTSFHNGATLVGASYWATSVGQTNKWSAGNSGDSLLWTWTDGVLLPNTKITFATNGVRGLGGSLYLESSFTNNMVWTNETDNVSFTNQNNILVAKNLSLTANTSFITTTNAVALYGSGNVTNNVTYIWNGSYYTNNTIRSSIVWNNPVWNNINQAGVIQYSASTLNGTWSIVNGNTPAPTNASFGYYKDSRGEVILGELSSTNLDQRFLTTSNGVLSTVTSAAIAATTYSLLYTNIIFITETLPVAYTPETLATGRYVASSPTNFVSDVGILMYKTNAGDWVLDSTEFLYGVLYHCPSNFPVGPWYPDDQFPGQLNRLIGSQTISNTAGMAQQSREALRVYQPTKSGVPFVNVAVSPADANSMQDAVTLVKSFGMQGLISVLEIDNWMASTRNAQNQLQFDTGLFPGGWTLQKFSEFAHTNGFGAGIRLDAGVFTGANGQFGSEGYYDIDANGVATNGIDFVLLDTTQPESVGQKNPKDLAVEFINAMHEKAAAAGAPVHVFGAFHGGFPHNFQSWMPVADSWWVSTDSADISELLVTFRQSLQWNGRGSYMRFANPGTALVSSNGARQMLGLAAVAPACIQVLTNVFYDVGFRTMFQNTGWRDAWQDAAGARGSVVYTNSSGMIVSRPLANGDMLLMFLNLSNGVTTLTAKWPDMGLQPNRSVFAQDLWFGTNDPTAWSQAKSITLPANDAALWQLTPIPTSGQKVLTFQNVITLGTKFTNSYSMNADLVVGYTLVGAVGGNPTLVYSNFTTGDFFDQSTSVSEVANHTNWVTIPDLAPNEIIGFYDRSAGAGASVTVNKSSLKVRTR